MQPYEIVTAAIEFRRPPRLPVLFADLGVDDTAQLPVKAAASFAPAVEGEDEWGCVWRKARDDNMGQVKGHPIADAGDLSALKCPDYDDDSRYVDAPAALEQAQRDGKYVLASIFMVLFERMHVLTGFENCLAGLLAERTAYERLADRIVQAHLGFVANVQRRFGGAVHGFGMSDDWGTQQAAFISFDLWMDFFFPRYKRLFDAMHAGGQHVWVHSCGKVNEIIEGYIRAGVDVVNLQQPRALGIEEVGRRYAGRITFQSLADIQATLPGGDRAKVDADVRQLMRHWARPEGGFILSDYGGDEAIGIKDPTIKRHMYDRFSEASERLYGQPLPEPKQRQQP